MSEQILANILYLFGNLFRIYLIYQFLKIFFDPIASKVQLAFRYATFMLFFIINSAGFMGMEWSSNAVLLSNYIGAFIITLTYTGKWKYRAISTIIVITLNLICEDLIYRLMLHFEIENIIVVTVAVTNLLLLMIILLLQKLSDIQHGEEITAFEWIGIITVTVISSVISVVTLADCSHEVSTTIGGVGLLLLNIIVFYLLERLTKMYKKHAQMIALESQNQAYEKQLDIMKQSEEKAASVRHDIRNHMTVLQYLSEKYNNHEIIEYLGKINGFVKNEERFVCTGDYLIDGLINMKLSEAAKRLGAEIHNEVHIENTEWVDKMDISILIGNLLDNALDALELCTGKRNLNLVIEEKRGVMLIEIENSYEHEIKYKNGIYVSTKADREHHGIGTKNIRNIVEKYNGQVDFYHDNNTFSVELIMYIK